MFDFGLNESFCFMLSLERRILQSYPKRSLSIQSISIVIVGIAVRNSSTQFMVESFR